MLTSAPKFILLCHATFGSFSIKQLALLPSISWCCKFVSLLFIASLLSFFVFLHFLANSMVPSETWTFLELLETPRKMEAVFALNCPASLTNGIFYTGPTTVTQLQFWIFATMTPLLWQLYLKITNNMVLPWTNLSIVVIKILKFFFNSDKSENRIKYFKK